MLWKVLERFSQENQTTKFQSYVKYIRNYPYCKGKMTIMNNIKHRLSLMTRWMASWLIA